MIKFDYLFSQQGFTLLELLVVLVVLSLLTGLAAPRLVAMYDSFHASLERDEVLIQLGKLNYLAFQQGHDFELTTYPLVQKISTEYEEIKSEIIDKKKTINNFLELPEGWRVHTKIPILFRANGVCSGGLIYLNHQIQEFRVQLAPPFCQPKLL
ncbi:prepilin-type N-terminal cleavage/methylation domain-containing protein [Candidatus Parabeggiatoa sp. HSG14]|uniref:prepilin-type N-terminal cleavage/methylation domain-containing protein n=1 Tax=Candidatus Parabeggiatoa sp. HSG14 TaxID=3055593 RepID=UPI0025A88FC3|nr:prepilin-type N-terminal cleavage/methylation domain-containing protein [Thiotrichales bacterium HSG14]